MSIWITTLLQESSPADPEMTGASWIFMGLAWLFVICLAVWCFWRVLGGGRKQP